MRIKESLNVTFNESLPEPKSPLVIEDDGIHQQVVQDPISSPSLEANALEPGYLESIKEARGNPIEKVIDELNERALRLTNANVKSYGHYLGSDDENVNVGKESARNGEWVKISMSKTEILKENQNMKKELKELTATTETSLNSSNKCDTRKPIWYLDNGCSRHMNGVKSYLHKYVEQPGPKVTINHEKYTLVIVDEYSSYTWVYFLKKKSHAPETIMSFIKRVENQNDIKVKQLRTDNGTEFENSILVNFCDEKRISQNFSSPYTPEQNGIAKRKNRTLQAARTIFSGSVFSKLYLAEVVATTCYT
ncbi:retrovirus-related pol polyprotein from transposon TNT 1-94 [Tanacetum coccineum]